MEYISIILCNNNINKLFIIKINNRFLLKDLYKFLFENVKQDDLIIIILNNNCEDNDYNNSENNEYYNDDSNDYNDSSYSDKESVCSDYSDKESFYSDNDNNSYCSDIDIDNDKDNDNNNFEDDIKNKLDILIIYLEEYYKNFIILKSFNINIKNLSILYFIQDIIKYKNIKYKNIVCISELTNNKLFIYNNEKYKINKLQKNIIHYIKNKYDFVYIIIVWYLKNKILLKKIEYNFEIEEINFNNLLKIF